MGCDYSKEVKKDFTSRIKQIQNKIAALVKRKSQLEELLHEMGTPKEPSITEDDIRSELNRRLERLEEMIKEIHKLNKLGNSDTFTPSNFRSYNSVKIEESVKFEKKEESFEEDSEQSEEKEESDIKEEASQKKTHVVFNVAAIIEDPSIKAIIEKKRKMLEGKNKAANESLSTELKETGSLVDNQSVV
ncbi:unnamed protein product [Blepharisma stoltei]|uniref:Uncharacterized protein n=1 Tax=Blepharisma stoltei TaxID=1481888 RepID=A0AAU9J6X3_9CILI|nr:unnamed protein product [Blepharisma stoltei]